eukprot:6491937-Amphidinium_carterae.2
MPICIQTKQSAVDAWNIPVEIAEEKTAPAKLKVVCCGCGQKQWTANLEALAGGLRLYLRL